MSGTDPNGTHTVQYRVVVAKGDERTEGPDGADVVFTIALADVSLDPTVAFMRGRLKVSGHTGAVLEQLRSGQAAAVLSRLASPS